LHEAAVACAHLLVEEHMPLLLRAVREHWRDQIPNGMTLAQFRALMFIARNGGTGLGGVAAYFTISMATASSTVSRLIAKGLVRVQQGSEDRRRIELWATRSGRAVEERASRHAQATFVAYLSKFSIDELDEISASLRKITSAISNGAGTAVQPLRRKLRLA
jgi:DNA-binding MarR family transcriptional regulator